MSGLRYTTPAGLRAQAHATTIMDRVTSQRALWRPWRGQVAFWKLLEAHRFLFYAKPRKDGISIAATHADLWETNGADAKGHMVRSVFAIDTDPKALEHLERCADMADQWEMPVRARRSAPYGLLFPNGARLDFLTMGSDEPGRGGDIHRLHITELPFGAHPEKAYHALRSACADNAAVLIETTLTTLDPFTASLWRGARRDPTTRKVELIGTEFHRHVSYVQDQKTYRLPFAKVAHADAT